MSTNVLSPSITLVILNPEKLHHGTEPQHRFDRAGGTLGRQGAWQLHDRESRILPAHCEIRWHEGHFCLIDHSGSSFMNGHDTALISGTPIQLRHNDRLQIGDYQIAIHLLGHDETKRMPQLHTASDKDPLWEQRMTQQPCPLQVLGVPTLERFDSFQTSEPKPLGELDPLAYLDRAARARIDPNIARIFGKEAQ
ncbi:FHA domain-containing protein [Serratia sp. Se-PFBMAAmG]|nr:FHA domain-containing protein [Serratia sp. Se-PFBMAAmG]